MIFSKSFRHRIYNTLHSKGIIVHKKETTPFLGKQIFATKGAFYVLSKTSGGKEEE